MITVEVCCGSYEDCYNAYLGKAQRVELNSGLYLGGLTPSIASLQLTKKNTKLEVICMVRTRGGSFCYSELEYEQMFVDAKILLENGADGIVFGFLNEDCTINVEQTRRMVDLVHSHNKQAVIHRAFDGCPNMEDAIQSLISCKVDRVLTSGFGKTAMDGLSQLAHLQQRYGNEIEILPGGSINENNVQELLNETKVTQVHSACRKWVKSNTTANPNVDYSFDERGYDCVDIELVKALVEAVK